MTKAAKLSKTQEYQDWTVRTAIYRDSIEEYLEDQHAKNSNRNYPKIPGANYEALMLEILYLSSGLGGETGEVQNQIKKLIRDGYTDSIKDKIHDELGDVLWYVARLCATLGLDMEEVMQYNREKLEKRQAEGKLKGSGDNR
jgi:NTP pyrophosphatase (non-canonical NTP hydrolase)